MEPAILASRRATLLRPPLARLNSFVKAAGAQEGETVVMSWVEWPDKAARDAGMAKVTSDPRMQFARLPYSMACASSLGVLCPC
ncbi:DUF1428 family protein [Variovorax sp. VRV01]|uniref:DUF1428 family protein n=1 Tax=Variovorax sp. VRV01 TaxID=2769259 RepID=UPI0017829939|nr:DUF1428 family protein [Variovorax sp. VRV01]